MIHSRAAGRIYSAGQQREGAGGSSGEQEGVAPPPSCYQLSIPRSGGGSEWPSTGNGGSLPAAASSATRFSSSPQTAGSVQWQRWATCTSAARWGQGRRAAPRAPLVKNSRRSESGGASEARPPTWTHAGPAAGASQQGGQGQGVGVYRSTADPAGGQGQVAGPSPAAPRSMCQGKASMRPLTARLRESERAREREGERADSRSPANAYRFVLKP